MGGSGYLFQHNPRHLNHQNFLMLDLLRLVSLNQFKVKGYNNQIGRILEPVARGFGFTVLPEYACLGFGQKKEIKYLKMQTEIHDPIYCIKLQTGYWPKRFDLVEEQLKKFLNKTP